MESTQRLRLLSDPETSYADRLNDAKTRVQLALATLKTERESLARLLQLIEMPDGRTH